MKKLIASLLLLSSAYGYSCSIVFSSFCEFSQNYGTVVRCVMIDSVQHGRRFQVLDVIKGTESRDTITIWNGTDFDCNGPVSQSAEYMGQIGDTLLAALTPVDSVSQPWQVIGDYVRTYNFGYTPELRFANDSLYGRISGGSFVPQELQVWKMAYSNFMQYWNAHSQTCNTLAGVSDIPGDALIVYPNPVARQLNLSYPLQNTPFTLHSLTGPLIKTDFVSGSSINLSDVPAGVYFLVLQTQPSAKYFRVVKQ